jgi:hypothetical protein
MGVIHIVKWRCPYKWCQTINYDSSDNPVPVCEDCLEEVPWDEIDDGCVLDEWDEETTEG